MEKRQILYTLIFTLLFYQLDAQVYNFVASDSTGCDSLNVQFSLIDTTGISTASWDFGNGDVFNGISPPVITYDTPGVYDVTATLDAVVVTKNAYIVVGQNPVSGFVSDDSATLNSFNILFTVQEQPPSFDQLTYFYDWNFGDGNTYTGNQIRHEHRYSGEGEYYVSLTVRDLSGCSSSFSDTITVSDRFNANNIFTPNGDNINDFFVIKTNGVTIYSMTIFGRSGVMVFKMKGPTLIWDGRNNSGLKMPPGIYYYLVKEEGGSGQSYTGFFYMYY